MTSPPIRRALPGPRPVASAICLVAYAFWATGLRPFTVPSYLAVAIPVLFVGCLAVFRSGPPPAGDAAIKLGGVLPWLLIALVGLGLECAGLALGGRSRTVPTLSTVIDHTLVWHGLRLVLFCGWLLIGLVPVARMLGGRQHRAG